MKPFYTLLLHELTQNLKRPWAFVWLISLPFCLALLMDAVFGSNDQGSGHPTISFAILDQDNSVVSQLLITVLAQNPYIDNLKIHAVESIPQGVQLMKSRQASALVIFPEAMGQDLYDDLQVRLQLYKNPAESMMPAAIEQGTHILATALGLIADIVREPLKEAEARSEYEDVLSDQFVTDIAILSATILRQVRQVTLPPLIQFDTISAQQWQNTEGTQSTKKPNRPFMQFFPGLLFMWLFFLAQSVMEELISDRDTGLHQRLLTTPLTQLQYLLVKCARALIVCFIAEILLIIASSVMLQVNWGNPVSLLLVLVASNLCVIACLLLLFSLTRTRERANAISNIFIILLAIAGGSLITYNQLPQFIQWLGVLTPNYWGIQALHAIIEQHPDYTWLTNTGVLFSYALTLSAITYFALYRKPKAGKPS